MNHHRHERPDAEVVLVRALLDTNAAIVGDIAQISDDTWAIHGVIAVDGAVIMAEFTTYDEARTVLDQLPRGTARRVLRGRRPAGSRPPA